MVLDSVDDSDESDAADMGRLGERLPSDLISVGNICLLEAALLAATVFAVIATFELEVAVLAVAITWGEDSCVVAEIINILIFWIE